MADAHAFGARNASKADLELTATKCDEYRDAALEKRSGAFPNGAGPYPVIAVVKNGRLDAICRW